MSIWHDIYVAVGSTVLMVGAVAIPATLFFYIGKLWRRVTR